MTIRAAADWKWTEEQAVAATRMACEGHGVELIALKVRKSEWQVRRWLKWHGVRVKTGREIRVPDRIFRRLEMEAERRGYECDTFGAKLIELVVKDDLVNAVFGS